MLDIVKEYKYLGVIFDEHLNFEECSKTLADSGGRALSAIISKFKQFKDNSYSTFCTLFNTGVIPIVQYGCSVWGFNDKNKHSDMIQKKAIRYFLGDNNFTPIPALYGEMGWLPSKYGKMICMIQLWNRLIRLSNDRLTKHIFRVDYEKSVENNNWCHDIRQVFRLLGKPEYFEKLCECDISYSKEKFRVIAVDEWKELLQTKPKLRTYIKYKCNLEVTDYVKQMTNKFERSLLAKFRCGILQLSIETGRYTNVKLDEHKCTMCDNDEIEDELHFLCKCPYYSEYRDSLYEYVENKHQGFMNISVDSKFEVLMTSYNYKVAKFIKSAWEKRKSKLFN